ncbi:MAG: hypothetical protein IPP48_05530 [Chitinophagaceae bacterium]|nr:hypothetical protein [Chitinophagaceae bacterium]
MHNIIFEYKAPILLFFLLFFSKLDFAQNLPVGAKIVSALQVTKDLKKIFMQKEMVKQMTMMLLLMLQNILTRLSGM